jgi:uncharacterized protein YqkB
MELIFTEEAIERLNRKVAGKEGVLKLKHDTEGCGCIVSGVSALWLVNHPEEHDLRIKTNGPVVFMDSHTELFFDQKMMIDGAKGNHFMLKSDSETLNPSLKYLDRTDENTGK